MVTLESLPQPALILGSANPEAKAFADAHGLAPEIERAVSLIREVFPSDSTASLRVFQDPESENRWLVIDLVSPGTVNEVLASFDSFQSRWVAVTAPRVRDLLQVNFTLV